GVVEQRLMGEDQGDWSLAAPVEQIDPGVPDTLREMLEVQFDQLSPAEQRVLKAGSVAGERFSAWAIAASADYVAEYVEEVCEGLAERGQFIQSEGIHELARGVASPLYHFRHSLYREALYRRMSAVNRSRLHRNIGERLELLYDRGRTELASELALHFEEGREPERAVRYL